MRKEQCRGNNEDEKMMDRLSELLEAGRTGNVMALSGEIKRIEEITQICGFRYEGYRAEIQTTYRSGESDIVIAVFDKGAAGVKTEIPGACPKIGDIQKRITGSKVIVTGKAQILKDFETGRKTMFLLADYIRTAEHPLEQNDVAIAGKLAFEPTYRVTPRGKRIADIKVAVQSELTGGMKNVPCICWEEQAEEVAGWKAGDEVMLIGRYQNREYEKVIDAESGEKEKRITQEISVREIRRRMEEDA